MNFLGAPQTKFWRKARSISGVFAGLGCWLLDVFAHQRAPFLMGVYSCATPVRFTEISACGSIAAHLFLKILLNMELVRVFVSADADASLIGCRMKSTRVFSQLCQAA